MRVYFNKATTIQYHWWKQVNYRIALRIDKLKKDIKRDPYSGLGKPERLKHYELNTWSRRIDEKNRLTYRIIDTNNVEIIGCIGHYGDK